MLPDLLRTGNVEHKLGVRKVTSVGTIVQLFNASPHSKQILQQVDRLLRIYLTVPMASATAVLRPEKIKKLFTHHHDSETT